MILANSRDPAIKSGEEEREKFEINRDYFSIKYMLKMKNPWHYQDCTNSSESHFPGLLIPVTVHKPNYPNACYWDTFPKD